MSKTLCSPNPLGIGTRFFSKFWSSFSFGRFNSRKKTKWNWGGVGGGGGGGLFTYCFLKT